MMEQITLSAEKSIKTFGETKELSEAADSSKTSVKTVNATPLFLKSTTQRFVSVREMGAILEICTKSPQSLLYQLSC